MVIGEVAGLDLRSPAPTASYGKDGGGHQGSTSGVAIGPELRQLGARVLEVPTIALAPPADDGRALLAALDGLGQGAYPWTVFTSSNAVERFFEHVPDSTFCSGRPRWLRSARARPSTLRAYRVVADLVPTSFRAEGLAAAFPCCAPPPAPRRVLLPQAGGARPELRAELSRRGWDVDAVEAYRTVPQRIKPALLAAAARPTPSASLLLRRSTSYLDQAGTAPRPP